MPRSPPSSPPPATTSGPPPAPRAPTSGTARRSKPRTPAPTPSCCSFPLVYDERALAMGENAARAAEAAGVRHLVINAGAPLPPEPIGVPFLDARHRAAGAGVPLVTVLQPTTYLENLNSPWSGERVVRGGVVAYPRPAAAPVYWVSAQDVAVAVRRALDRSVAGWFALPGEPLTGDELAHSLGEALGRRLRWQTISPEAFADALRPHLGDHAAEGTAAVYRMLAEMPPGPAPDPAPAREALDWAPRDPATWAREAPWPLPLAA